MEHKGRQYFSDPSHVGKRVITLQSGLALVLWRNRPVMRRQLASPLQFATKRAIDIVISAFALVILMPGLLAIGIAIRASSPGKALFRQRRLGLNGQYFYIYKFRSMYRHNQDLSGVRQTLADDPRVTPVGRWLRLASLDELPQLWNVLIGDMSLIGPRPHVEGMISGGQPYEALVPYYNERLRMRPGLSGWAQINGLRGPTTDAGLARARIDHDVAYIQNYSLRLDLVILWRTVMFELWKLGGH